ncbi:MAG TPA: hypothetical protein VMU24_14130 [Candidatus Acidoferrales bacterium]|nr:hypothetical protein [Candidatus Acidoferrales bacterium]
MRKLFARHSGEAVLLFEASQGHEDLKAFTDARTNSHLALDEGKIVTKMIFADENGKLVGVARYGEDMVEFKHQGEGFVRELPRAQFDTLYVATDIPVFTEVLVEPDWAAGVTFPAYSSGQRWNGWAMPYFTRENGLRVCEIVDNMRYDESQDAFVAPSDDGSDEVFRSQILVVEGKDVHVYAIGTGSWWWAPVDALSESVPAQ